MPVHRTCPVCGKVFSLPPSVAATRRTCGVACQYRRPDRYRTPPGPRIERSCLTCGKVFSRRPSDVAHRPSVYCSKACRPPAARVVRACAHCGRLFLVPPSALRAGSGKHCSVACYRAHGARHGDARKDHPAPEYRVWVSMRQRCSNPKTPTYAHYGGRGITVCDRWRGSYAAFLADVGRRPSPAHSIDRIDNDGNYEPGNVRWATRREQRANQRSLRRSASRHDQTPRAISPV